MIYDIAKKEVLREDLTTGLSVMLMTDGYVSNTGHETVSDVEADEFADADYSRKTVQNVAVVDNGDSFDVWGNNIFWDGPLTGTVGGVIFYYSGFLLAFFDTTDTVLDSESFKVSLHSDGIVGVNI